MDLTGTIDVVVPDPVVVDVVTPTVIVNHGTGGGGGVVLEQSTPAAQWSWPNPLGRMCGVSVYVAGEQVDADVTVTPTLLTVTFPTPTRGVLVAT